jgi:hypothetical protein
MKKMLFVWLTVLFVSCQNPAKWYPQAEVSIEDTTEYTDVLGGNKTALITLLIHNTGDTSIVSTVITIKAVTDKRTYTQTAVSSTRIIPDGKIALSVTVPYLDATEQFAGNGVTIFDAFFE